jgi:predicted RNase H-like nuclease (RuvC/YqgF family)
MSWGCDKCGSKYCEGECSILKEDLDDLRAEIEKLKKDNTYLAAHQCKDHYDRERGHMKCREIDKRDIEINLLKEAVTELNRRYTELHASAFLRIKALKDQSGEIRKVMEWFGFDIRDDYARFQKQLEIARDALTLGKSLQVDEESSPKELLAAVNFLIRGGWDALAKIAELERDGDT